LSINYLKRRSVWALKFWSRYTLPNTASKPCVLFRPWYMQLCITQSHFRAGISSRDVALLGSIWSACSLFYCTHYLYGNRTHMRMLQDCKWASNSIQIIHLILTNNSVALVRVRTRPTERRSIVGEVSAQLVTWSAWRIPTALLSAFQTGAATFSSK
jgi:hypothetical protein